MKERGNFIETFKIKTLFPSSLLRKKATRKKMKNRKRGKVRRKASPILILSILIDPDAPLLEWSAAFVGGRVTRATDIDHPWQWHMFRAAFRLGSTVIGNNFRHRYTLPKYFYPTPTETEYLEIWTFLTLYLLFLLFHYEKSKTILFFYIFNIFNFFFGLKLKIVSNEEITRSSWTESSRGGGFFRDPSFIGL